MPENPKSFATAAKRAHKDGLTLQGEVNAVLQQLAGDATFASQFYEAVDNDDRKRVISLLKAAGIKQSRIESLELFPGNLKVKVDIDFKNMRLIVEIDTSS